MSKRICIKNKGSISVIIPIIILAIIGIGMIASWLVICILENQNIQDSLQYSQMSCYSKIDKKILGENEEYAIFSNPNDVLNEFRSKLKKNLDLNDDFTMKNSATIKDKINIDEFIIYNVQGDKVDIYTLSKGGSFTKATKDIGPNIKTPNGLEVKSTTIHTTLIYDVNYLISDKEDNKASLDTDIIKYDDDK